MFKDKIKILFAIPLLFIIASCSNLINYSHKTDLEFSIDSSNSRYINQTLSQYRSFTKESELEINVKLLKNGKIALNDKRITPIEYMSNETFSFKDLPLGEYQVEVEIEYEDISIFYGKSNVVTISQENLTPNCNITLDKVMHTITYVLNGGELQAEAVQSYFPLSNIFILEPTRGEDKFIGWYLNEDFSGEQVTTLGIDSNITDDITLYAKWDEYTPRLIISTEGNINELVFTDKVSITCQDPITDIYYTLDKTDPATSGTRKEYTTPFTIDSDVTINAIATYKGKTIKAKPKSYVRLYTIKFDTSGMVRVPDQILHKGELIKEPQMEVVPGHTLVGWFTSKAYTEQYDFSSPVSYDRTIFAQWDPPAAP